MQKRKIYLQLNDHSILEPEEAALKKYYENSNENVDIIPFYKKHMLRGRYQISKNDFVAGEIDTMHYVFKKLGIDFTYEDYPQCLRKYLHRNIWEDTAGNIRSRVLETGYLDTPIFIKPKDRLKAFTGFVLSEVDDLYQLKKTSNSTHVWCSDVVGFVNEYRFYIINGEVKASALCPTSKNADDITIDIPLVYKAAKEHGKTCVMDFGKLSTGETALIEVNESYSVGLYDDFLYARYAEMLISKWDEMMRSIKS